VEPRERGSHYDKGERKSQHYRQKRFTEKLAYQLSSHRTHSLSDPHFFRSLLSTRRAQVHKVYTGKYQHKYPDDTKQPHILYAPSCVDTVLPFGMKVPFIHWVQKDLRVYGNKVG